MAGDSLFLIALTNLSKTKASVVVIVDHADSLHEGITDRRADKFESARA